MRQGITEEQSRLLASWLGEFSVVQDCSWPLQDTNVLHVATPAGEGFIVKASTTSHHIRREIAAHSGGFEGLRGRVPALRHASAEAGILVTEFLPGTLVEGTPAEEDPETYRQAGALLARIHRPAGDSSTYATALTAKTRAWMDRAHGLLPEPQLDSFERELDALRPRVVQLVATHGDYQPRNWLQDNGQIKVIDFGRADLRPWVHDLVRLSHQRFVDRPDLADAFHAGLGKTVAPAETDLWRLENLNQAIGTVVWAHQMGDTVFEQTGRTMVKRVLSGF
ncbi:aminoglycoside phosphotransferase family protein [Pseudarthrobacter sp. RMG13]|uniref:Aminoglycoside phosphotransferase family protein n=1 Tax=Pseudarthrobacter humi TaxID=2952523 RepID=A0ABT1LQF5_9MICC|nr:aminoglycoside phosphotransferase family protein [Pseudarthrobacter humi]MCP9000695.1 aminoglycoside phosphotransferase family protein [Pseudarthrobacter humi]